jgi:hypothetical protein
MVKIRGSEAVCSGDFGSGGREEMGREGDGAREKLRFYMCGESFAAGGSVQWHAFCVTKERGLGARHVRMLGDAKVRPLLMIVEERKRACIGLRRQVTLGLALGQQLSKAVAMNSLRSKSVPSHSQFPVLFVDPRTFFGSFV